MDTERLETLADIEHARQTAWRALIESVKPCGGERFLCGLMASLQGATLDELRELPADSMEKIRALALAATMELAARLVQENVEAGV